MLLTEMRNTESTMQFIYTYSRGQSLFLLILSESRTFSFSDEAGLDSF
mgnify:CR=1 FL=1